MTFQGRLYNFQCVTTNPAALYIGELSPCLFLCVNGVCVLCAVLPCYSYDTRQAVHV